MPARSTHADTECSGSAHAETRIVRKLLKTQNTPPVSFRNSEEQFCALRCRALPRFRSGERAPCPVSGRASFGLEAELHDLSVERAPADVQDARRLFLVPRHRLEHAYDVRSFRFAQRGEPCGCLLGRCGLGVEELDIGVAYDAARSGERRARDGAFQLADIPRPVVSL